MTVTLRFNPDAHPLLREARKLIQERWQEHQDHATELGCKKCHCPWCAKAKTWLEKLSMKREQDHREPAVCWCAGTPRPTRVCPECSEMRHERPTQDSP